jgi:hypothetical protein
MCLCALTAYDPSTHTHTLSLSRARLYSVWLGAQADPTTPQPLQTALLAPTDLAVRVRTHRRARTRTRTRTCTRTHTHTHMHIHRTHTHTHTHTHPHTHIHRTHTHTLKDTHTHRRFPSLCLSYPRGVVRGGGQARVDMGWVVAGARAELPAAAGVAAEVGLGASPLSVAIDGHVMVRALQLASTLAVAAAARRVRDADAIVCRSMYAYGHLCLCVCLRVSVSVCVCVSLSPHLGVYY